MLSIIIPYYKIAFFKETLDSLAIQTDKRFKVYIGDDASSEDPLFLLNNYKNSFDFSYHRFEKNIGGTCLTRQWKRCIDLSSNEQWLMILGDDDVLDENVIEEFYKNIDRIENKNIDVIRYATQKINEKGEINSHVFTHPVIEKATDFIIRKYKHKTRSSLSEYVFKKHVVEILNKVNFPLAWNSDVALMLEMSKYEDVFTINEAIISVRISDQSISGSKKYESEKSTAKSQFEIYLIKNLNKFSKNQRNFLILKFENSFLNNKKEAALGFSVFKYYFLNFEFFNCLKLINKTIAKVLEKRSK